MCFEQFMQSFIPKLLATFIGALIGIPIALWINRLLEKRKIKKQNTNLINALLQTIQTNISKITQMTNELATPDYVIFYNVDLELLESTSSLKYELLQDIELCSEIDTLRYELCLLHRKVELLLELAYGVQSALQNVSQLRSNIQQGIIVHINDLILPLLNKIKDKLNNLLKI